MDLKTFEHLQTQLKKAALSEDKTVRHDVAVAIYSALCGEPPAFDPAMLERLRDLNQQFTREKNEAVAARSVLAQQLEVALSKAANSERVLREHQNFTTLQQEVRAALAEIQIAAADMNEAIQVVGRAVG